MSDARNMLLEVREKLFRTYGRPIPHLGIRTKLPPGVTLEVHPEAYRALMQTPDLYQSIRMTNPLQETLGDNEFEGAVALEVSKELPENGWRLVVTTKEVLKGGVLGAAPADGVG